MDVSSFRFTGAMYAIRLTADPDDTRVLQISSGMDGGLDVAIIQQEGYVGTAAIRLTCARDLFNFLDRELKTDRHPLDGVDTVEQEARRMVAARGGLGRPDSPEALAAWESLSVIEKTREKVQARTRLDIANISSTSSSPLIDPIGATLEMGQRLKFKAIALLSNRMDGNLEKAHQTWAGFTKRQKMQLMDKARSVLAMDLIDSQAGSLYIAENAGNPLAWKDANENEKNSYRAIARDELVEKAIIDADGRLIYEGDIPA